MSDDQEIFEDGFEDGPRSQSDEPTLTELLLLDIAHQVGAGTIRRLVKCAEAEREAGHEGASLSDEEASWTLSVGERGMSVYYKGWGPFLLSEAGVELVLGRMEEDRPEG